ncbi:MAG: ABC-F family ATP-binding cassette domain-containing protein [Anaeromyxobacter sp.]|nr:ABC-F family ATP-binding cassette domain-containing protein [Anaeromyxobacter sp.]MBL0276370.1 ABC-F family ATP-binding cassette domain-containing protein [Anaeromyxobacter sp.]
MSLCVATGISLAHGPKVLFHGAGFTVGPQDRIGLLGANGTGKSTLLRILAGEVSPDEGTLTWRRGTRVGYLPQDVAALPAGTVLESVLAAVPGRSSLEERLLAAEAGLAAATDEEAQLELSAALADLHEQLDHFEERFGRHRAERLLGGLGFTLDDLSKASSALSGGWKMRAALAGLLLQDPDLLLLDEPTNHLDIPTLTWFDAFLRGLKRAVLLVSHDRDFLDRQVGKVLALEPEGIRAYAGGVTAYRQWRVEEEARLEAAAKKQQDKRDQLEGFIERFGAKATKAAQAKSKQKLLDKMEDVQVLEDRATVRFRFAEAPRSGKEVLRFDGIAKAFGPRVVYRGLTAAVQRGERVGVIGPNGAGKSTLLKLAAGALAADAGTVKPGHGVVMGYYAQHLVDPEGLAAGSLDPAATILDTLWDLVPDRGESYVRSIAGSFLFSGEDVEKKIGVLSGGERARVALAKLLLVPANLLLLDEPTNHLDLDSSESLIEALKGFPGTLLFVSHNRSFVNQLATVIWEVKDGGILPHPGNLDDWLYHQRQLEEAAGGDMAGPGEGAGGAGRPEAGGSERDRKRAQAEARNARYRRERPLREALARVEGRIAALEAAARTAEAALADPALYTDFARARPLIEQKAAAEAELAGLYRDWERTAGELEALGADEPGA